MNPTIIIEFKNVLVIRIDLNFLSETIPILTSQVLLTNISDHYATYTVVKLKPKRNPRLLVSNRSFKRYHSNSISSDPTFLMELHSIYDSSDLTPIEKLNKLERSVISAVNRLFPTRTLRVRKDRPPWLDDSNLKLIRLKNKFYKQVFNNCSTATANQIQAFKRFRNYVTNELRRSKKTFYKTLITEDSSFHNTIKKMMNTSANTLSIQKICHNSEVLSAPADIANALNDYFCKIGQTPLISQKHKTTRKPDEPNIFQSRLKFALLSESTIEKALASLPSRKRGGVSRLPTYIYQDLSSLIVPLLTEVFNCCILSSTFPDCLKLALVTPIYKNKGVKHDPANYRPISSLPVLSKVFEKILSDQISIHLERNSLLSDRQFGFRKHHSTEQMLLSLLHKWYPEMDKPSPVYITALSLDIRKAFDSVNHQLLISKLENFGLNSEATLLIQSYLNGRKQVMQANNTTSESREIISGVPQRSILGPLLFNIMVNDLLESFPNAFAYADDTVIYSITPNLDQSTLEAASLFKTVKAWYTDNNFVINVSKTQACIFTNRKLTTYPHVDLDEAKIQVNPCIKLLGVTLDSNLTFGEHISQVIASTNRLIYLFRKTRTYMNVPSALMFYTTYIRPHLTYCPALLLNSNITLLEKLEAQQNKCTRIILNAPKIFSVSDGKTLLNLVSLEQYRIKLFRRFLKKTQKIKISCYIQKVLSNAEKHDKVLRNSCSLVLPHARTKFGKSALLFLVISHMKTL